MELPVSARVFIIRGKGLCDPATCSPHKPVFCHKCCRTGFVPGAYVACEAVSGLDSDLQSSRCLIAAALCFLCGWHGPNPSKSIQTWWLFSFGPRANARELRQNAWHFGPKSEWSGTVRWQVGDLPRLFHQRHCTGRTSLPLVDDPWEAWFSIGFFSCPYVGRWY